MDDGASASRHVGRAVLAAVVALAVVATILVIGHDRSLEPARTVGDVVATGPPVSPSQDQQILASVGLGSSDVGLGYSAQLIEGGDQLTDPTLDFCGLHFASEARREARRQVAAVDSSGDQELDTESVLYRDQASAAEAMGEVRGVSSRCPSTPVEGPQPGDPQVVWHVAPWPQSGWSLDPGIDRVALDVTISVPGEPGADQLAVFLRRGRLVMGVYLAAEGPDVPVDGQETVAGMLAVFERRMAALPAVDLE